MKKELIQLAELIRKLADNFSDQRLVTMSVIIHNMAFQAASKDVKWQDFDDQLEILRLNAEFRPDCHVSQWAYKEAQMIIDGYFMSLLESNAKEEFIPQEY